MYMYMYRVLHSEDYLISQINHDMDETYFWNVSNKTKSSFVRTYTLMTWDCEKIIKFDLLRWAASLLVLPSGIDEKNHTLQIEIKPDPHIYYLFS